MLSLFESIAIALVIALPLVGCGNACSTEEQSAGAAESAFGGDADETRAASTTVSQAEVSASLANPAAATSSLKRGRTVQTP